MTRGSLEQWREALKALERLTLMRDILERPPLGALVEWVRSEAGADGASQAASRALYELSLVPRLWPTTETAPIDPWQAWLIETILTHDNLWSRRSERGEPIPALLDDMFRHDLRLLHDVRALLPALVRDSGSGLSLAAHAAEPPPPPVSGTHVPHAAMRAALVDELWNPRAHWAECSPSLKRYFQAAGAGLFNASVAFSWTGDPASGLEPITRLDPTRLSDLIGYESERGRVVENTDRFVAGLPAQHLLLYGDRGTGKSITVKALAHRYTEHPLRIIEVEKKALPSLPELTNLLAGRGLKFLLFVDDLSFEADETEYKELKSFLEGSVRAPQDHIRVYATSNRRHLVQESLAERSGGLGDVRARDTMQERLSLADRFGVTIIFSEPNQALYLEIVRGLARRRGLEIPDDALVRKALQWADWQNGRSARTARQFIDSVSGHLAPDHLPGAQAGA